jgi:hypothetical protein
LIYQGLEENNLDQKSPGPPGWGLMQRANYSNIILKKRHAEKTKDQALEIRWLHFNVACYYQLTLFIKKRFIVYPL